MNFMHLGYTIFSSESESTQLADTCASDPRSSVVAQSGEIKPSLCKILTFFFFLSSCDEKVSTFQSRFGDPTDHQMQLQTV